MSDDMNVHTVAAQVSVSSQLLSDAISSQRAFNEAYHNALIDGLLRPRTREQISAALAKREAYWDTQTAAGLVGVEDCAGYDESWAPDWRRVERGGYVDKWVTSEAWVRYDNARQALDEAEAAL